MSISEDRNKKRLKIDSFVVFENFRFVTTYR